MYIIAFALANQPWYYEKTVQTMIVRALFITVVFIGYACDILYICFIVLKPEVIKKKTEWKVAIVTVFYLFLLMSISMSLMGITS